MIHLTSKLGSSIISADLDGGRQLTDKIKAEFHCHSAQSRDGWPTTRQIIIEARNKGIQKLAITDHNSISAALEAKRLAPELVIVGEEVKTTVGEFLAYFVKEEVPRGLEPMDAIARLEEQGAFISLSHPFDNIREHWPEDTLKEMIPHLDGMEIFNARCFSPQPNQQAEEFAVTHGLLRLAGSDAHTRMEIGRATMMLPDFNSADELRDALKMAEMETQLSPFWVHLFSWSKSLFG